MIFPVEAVMAATAKIQEVAPGVGGVWTRTIDRRDDEWRFDTDEEFVAEYRSGPFNRVYFQVGNSPNLVLRMTATQAGHTFLEVAAPTRAAILAVVTAFDDYLDRVTRVEQAPSEEVESLTVFLGHGRNAQWRDLKDHLQDQQGIAVESFESGARAGHVVRDILGDLLTRSTFAILVMTGEDATEDGGIRARQNVVHESGLFQGRLGFPRAIVVVEEGVEVFSNLDGVQQIYFPAGSIRESFGDVVATIRREFPNG